MLAVTCEFSPSCFVWAAGVGIAVGAGVAVGVDGVEGYEPLDAPVDPKLVG